MCATSKKRNNGYIPNSGYFLIDQIFSSSDEFNTAVRGWDIDLNQLDIGPQISEVFQLSGRIQLGRARFNRRMEQLGTSPKDYCTFIIPSQKEIRYKSRSTNVTGNCIPIFNLQKELCSVSENNFDIIVYSIPKEVIQEISQIQGIPKIFDAINNHEIIPCLPNQVEVLRRRFHHFISEIQNDPLQLIRTTLIYELENSLPAQLLDVLAKPFEFSEPVLSRKRTVALRKIRDYLHDLPADLITSEQLCKITGYSKRTLEYVFQDYYGISPNAYLKKYRLNHINKELKNSDPEQVKIADIANKWGFWHMGQFAADYRDLFGQLPSETLRSNR